MKNLKIAFNPLKKAHSVREFNAGAGFTLIEIILISMVIMTLALIVFPNFSKSKKLAMKKEAISYVKLIAAAERIYRIENEFYAPCNNAADCSSMLSLMLDTNAVNWDYSVSATTDPTVTTINIIATNSPLVTGCTYSIDESRLDGEPAAAGCN